MEIDINAFNQQNPCGIKKIIDCKVNENGQQMYYVKWESTWEPAENLVTYQHLVDEFWSYVNRLKTGEHIALQHRNQINSKLMNHPNNDINLYTLTDDNKSEIQQLISRTNNSEVGTLLSPSNYFHSEQANSPNTIHSNSFNNTNNAIKGKTPIIKTEPLLASSPSNSNSKIGASGLKYIESFDNPYVKIIVVCKLCNKEQSMKHAHSWKQHFLTHSDQKPHNCPHCSKGFLRADRLRNHVQKYHGHSTQQKNMVPKHEQGFFFKDENY